MNTLIVVAHPRPESLTFAVAHAFAQELERCDHQVEWADLVRERFDPVLMPPDEPDWGNPDKAYSEAVQREMHRIERNSATVMVFPIWWWSLPAILKGWIDRVWNHGWAYGTRTYPHRKVWMIGVAGVGKPTYEKGMYDQGLRNQLSSGILEYCGVAEPHVELLYGAIESPEQASAAVERAKAIGAQFSA